MNKLTWRFTVIAAVCVLAIGAYAKYGINLGLDLKGGTSFLLRMDVSQIDRLGRSAAVQQAIEILRKRVDRFGVAEPVMQRVGEDRILVELPGLEEQRRIEAQRTIEQTAYLEFRLVHPKNEQLVAQSLNDPSFEPPFGYTNLVQTTVRDGQTTTHSYYVKLKAEQGLTGKYVQRAFVAYNNIGSPYIAMTFNSEGAKLFAQVVAANAERQLAIILDGEIQSAPVIQAKLSEDARSLGTIANAEISGTAITLLEAQRLASVLENPLQAPVKVLEVRGVDPTLGNDSIHSGIKAALIGAVAVVVFMAMYYLSAGMVANVALVMNILITVGVLALFKFTLTLPGIAGIVLSIGMAVDTNVLIYERVREELAANKPLRAAIAAAYTRAFRVIFDAHLTAILTALILIMLGSGPVKGFGVTLAIGLIANLFSGVFGTRTVFDWMVGKGWLKSFNMFHVFRSLPHINFLGVWKIAFAISWLIIIAGMVSFVQRGGLDVGRGDVYGIDFKGGDTATLGFVQRVNVDDIRRSLEEEKSDVKEAYIQYEHALGGGAEVLALKLPEGKTEEVVKHLQDKFPEAKFKVLGTEQVGAVVGQELLKQALWAVAASLLMIMVYIAFRFGEFSYGLGALISLIHDVLMTVGLFCLSGRSFSMPVVAAVLTLIGYSINDTIVVFDRIRENKKLTGGKLTYFDLINRSVNETLSRTILTAGTVFLCAVSLYVFGGRVLNDFAFCFVVGVLTGTYSSIYIASPCVLWYHRTEGNKARAKMEKTAPAKA
jgi:SecD/SecF fusion protein